jgi:hypothetical protein
MWWQEEREVECTFLATIYDPGMDNYQLRYPLAIVGSASGGSSPSS